MTEQMNYETLVWMIFGPSALMAYDNLLLKKGLELQDSGSFEEFYKLIWVSQQTGWSGTTFHSR